MPRDPDEEPLLQDIPAPAPEAWRAEVERLLAGAGVDSLVSRSVDGIALRPLYTRPDLDGLSELDSLPGSPPFLRGNRPAGSGAWEIAQELAPPEPEALAEALAHDLPRGLDAASLLLDEAAREGRDPGEARPAQVGAGGTAVYSAADVATALAAVDPATTPIHVRPGSAALPAAALIAAWLQAGGLTPADWRGSIGYDPLAGLAARGRLPLSLARAWDELALLTRWALAEAPQLSTLEVDAAAWADAGAGAAQQLGLSLASGAAALRALEARGLAPQQVAPRLRLRLGVGPELLHEVAKLRAARLLWSRLLEACGVEPELARVRCHAASSRWGRTLFDPHVNVVRGSLEALAGVLGGADSLHVAAWDEALGAASEPARRLARNTQLLLREESQLHRVADPLGGGWLVESLTRQLAEAAWSLLQRLEQQGGLEAALAAGTAQGLVAEAAAARERRLACGEQALVGTSRYADPAEPAPDFALRDAAALQRTAVARLQGTRGVPAELMPALDAIAAAAPGERFAALLRAARLGASLGELTKALRLGDDDPPRVAALRARGAAAGFEDLRRDVLAWRAREAADPQVYFACLGPRSEHAAPLDFARDFFAAAGFALADGCSEDVAGAVAAALASGAPAVVLVAERGRCADAAPGFAGGVEAARPGVWRALAGRPSSAAQRAAWRAAGLDACVHRGSDRLQLLGELARRLGARP